MSQYILDADPASIERQLAGLLPEIQQRAIAAGYEVGELAHRRLDVMRLVAVPARQDADSPEALAASIMDLVRPGEFVPLDVVVLPTLCRHQFTLPVGDRARVDLTVIHLPVRTDP